MSVRIEPFDLMAHGRQARALQTAALQTVIAATGQGSTDDDMYYGVHVTREGFRAVAAWVGERLVGFAYGYDEAPGSWWDGWVAPALEAVGEGRLLGGAFEVVELHVTPDLHGQGIGERLLRRLLAGLERPRVLLTTQGGANPARGFYRHLGFREVAPVPYGEVVFLVLTCELPLPSGHPDSV